MNKQDQKVWMEKNQKLNEHIELRLGLEVKDAYGNNGVIVKIEPWEGDTTDENHGAVFVWQSNRTEYGSDNCEHYTLSSWKSFLRITTEGVYPTPPAKNRI